MNDATLSQANLESISTFARQVETELLVVVFTDLVGSTALKSELGDERAWKLELLHRELLNESLDLISPTDREAVRVEGDSYLFVFHRPGDAVRFALHAQVRHAQERQKPGGDRDRLPEFRVGIHLGTVIKRPSDPTHDDLAGIQVDTGARIMSLAIGSQILCSEAVQNDANFALRNVSVPLVDEIEWRSHGDYAFKGRTEPLEIWEVRDGAEGFTRPLGHEKAWPVAKQDSSPGSDVDVVGQRESTKAPQKFGRYFVQRQLGQGAFGTVYLCEDRQLRRQVVVKAPRADRFRREEGVKAFLAEARALAALKHPQVITVFDAEQTEEGCFVVYEYVAGQDLREKLNAGPLSHGTAVNLIVQLAEALHHVHQHGIVHRDVKPSNILIDPEGLAHLADFGLALTEDCLGAEPMIVGTPAYMSPEQVRGEGHLVDGRSDIFSLGVVLYELLSNHQPFQAPTAQAAMEQIVNLEPRPLRQWDESIPEKLEWICRRALSKRISDRYRAAREMAIDLRSCLEQTAPALDSDLTSIAAGPPVVPKGLRPFDHNDSDFFLDLVPGPRDREGLPVSLRFWKQHLEQQDAEQTFRVGLLYGPSGCGKTSLFRAGLLPRLAKHVKPIYLEATVKDTERRLLSQLRRACPEIEESATLPEAFATLRRFPASESARKFVVVLDQFEQWLHANRQYADSDLASAFRQCDGGRVQCVLMVRDDFWMASTRFLRELDTSLSEGVNSSAVDLFDRRHALKVFTSFGQSYGALPRDNSDLSAAQNKFLDNAVTLLTVDESVIPVRLALFAEMVKGREWIPSTLKDLGGAEGVGVKFLDETFSADHAPPAHRLHEPSVRRILDVMLPGPETQIKAKICTREQLLEASGYTNRTGDFEEILQILDHELRLLTPIDPEGLAGAVIQPEKAPASRQFYQLTHDSLVPSIRAWLTRKKHETRSGRAELCLAQRTELWTAKPEKRQLPSFWEWVFILAYGRREPWNSRQRRMIGAASLHYWIRIGSAVLLLALLLTTTAYFRQRLESRHLVDQLLESEIALVPTVVKEINDNARSTLPMLRKLETRHGKDADAQLRIQLALVKHDDSLVQELRGRLLDAKPNEFPVIRDALKPYREAVEQSLWGVLTDDERDLDERFRAACALAAYDPDETRWKAHAAMITEQLVTENSLVIGEWIDALEPVKHLLLPPLQQTYRNRSLEQQRQRIVAAETLVKYYPDNLQLLVNLVLDATADQFLIVFDALDAHRTEAVALLEEVLRGRGMAVDAPRRANAAYALLLFDQPAQMWRIFASGAEPDTASLLVHHSANQRIDPSVVLTELRADLEPELRRQLLLTLAEIASHRGGLQRDQQLTNELLRWYETDPDPGVHSAAEWLLREWGQEEKIAAVIGNLSERDANPTLDPLTTGRKWRVNSQRQTLILIEQPASFQMGAGDSDAPEESLRTIRLPRSYAIGATEVTVGQWRRFEAFRKQLLGQGVSVAPVKTNAENDRKPHEVPSFQKFDDQPANYVSWYLAAAYCNWLTREEMGEQQICFVEEKDAAGNVVDFRLADDFSKRRGYRLPTEAEWEYACRAGTSTAYSFGDSHALLGHYAFFLGNSGQVTHRVGMRKPNAFGLFDMHGNVYEWCLFPDVSHLEKGEIVDQIPRLDIDEKRQFTVRGGGYYHPPDRQRSAHRHAILPASEYKTVGFRLARTLAEQ